MSACASFRLKKMGKGVSQAGNAASSEQHFWAEFYDSLANNSSWSSQPLENLNICRGLFVHFRIWDTKMSLGLEQLELNQSEKYEASNSRSNESFKMHSFQAGGASKLTWSNSWKRSCFKSAAEKYKRLSDSYLLHSSLTVWARRSFM